MGLDLLPHLDLLLAPLVGAQLGLQAAEVLGVEGLLVALTGLLLAGPLIVVESLSVELAPALNGVSRQSSESVQSSTLPPYLHRVSILLRSGKGTVGTCIRSEASWLSCASKRLVRLRMCVG